MSTKEKKLNECPTCEKSPCACPAKGGDAADEKEKNKTSSATDSTTENSMKNSVANSQEKLVTAVENTCAELLATSLLASPISFFGRLNNNAAPAENKLSSNTSGADNADENNTASTSSMSMGMSMSGSGE